MKKMKKFLSVLLASAMTLAMAAPGFAASGTGAGSETEGKITIKNAIPGKTYSIYKLFDLESYSYTGENGDENTDPPYKPAEGLYVYKVTSDWKEFMKEGDGSKYVNVDDQDYVTWKANENAEEFGKVALAYAKEEVGDPAHVRIAPTQSDTAATLTEEEIANKKDRVELSFGNQNLGYYLVDSSAGALCGLTTTNPEVNITEKNAGVPDVTKTIDGQYDAASAMIGAKIPYTVKITAKKGAENYVLHDKMTQGLDFNNDVKVTVGSTELTSDDYTVVTEGIGEDTFRVVFTEAYLNTITQDTVIVVTYSATLNETAVSGTQYKNNATVSYGDDGVTTGKETTTQTWEFNVLKYDSDDTTKASLAGATFTLSENADGTNPINFVQKDGKYQVCALDEHTGFTHLHVTEITTTADGAFNVVGLKAGTYYLTETAAPNGYNKLAGPVKVIIGEVDNRNKVVVDKGEVEAGSVVVETTDSNNQTVNKLVADKTVEVANNSGALLPSTGGIGTTIFYAAGIILMAGAVFFVVRRKRA